MRFRFKKPAFDVNDSEYVVPLRLGEDLCHSLMAGWHPIGFGWGHLRSRTDGSFDLFIRQAEVAEDMNLVKLDSVQAALFAALNLAIAVGEEEDYVSEKMLAAANDVRSLVSHVGKQ